MHVYLLRQAVVSLTIVYQKYMKKGVLNIRSWQCCFKVSHFIPEVWNRITFDGWCHGVNYIVPNNWKIYIGLLMSWDMSYRLSTIYATLSVRDTYIDRHSVDISLNCNTALDIPWCFRCCFIDYPMGNGEKRVYTNFIRHGDKCVDVGRMTIQGSIWVMAQPVKHATI